MSEPIATPDKNQLKRRVGMVFNDRLVSDTLNAFLFLPDPEEPRPMMRKKKHGKAHHEVAASSIRSTAPLDSLPPQVLRLAESGADITPKEWRERAPEGDQFLRWRQRFRTAILTTAHTVFKGDAWAFWEWTQLDLLITTWPTKRRDVPRAEWLPDWPEEARHYVLTRYTELEERLHQRDGRRKYTPEWTDRERAFYTALQLQDAHHWTHDLWQRIDIMIDPVRHQRFVKLRRLPADAAEELIWRPWLFALRFEPPAPEAPTEGPLTQAYLEACAAGDVNPDDPKEAQTFRTQWQKIQR